MRFNHLPLGNNMCKQQLRGGGDNTTLKGYKSLFMQHNYTWHEYLVVNTLESVYPKSSLPDVPLGFFCSLCVSPSVHSHPRISISKLPPFIPHPLSLSWPSAPLAHGTASRDPGSDSPTHKNQSILRLLYTKLICHEIYATQENIFTHH